LEVQGLEFQADPVLRVASLFPEIKDKYKQIIHDKYYQIVRIDLSDKLLPLFSARKYNKKKKLLEA